MQQAKKKISREALRYSVAEMGAITGAFRAARRLGGSSADAPMLLLAALLTLRMREASDGELVGLASNLALFTADFIRRHIMARSVVRTCRSFVTVDTAL